MSNSMKFPGRNIVTLCQSAVMLVVQQAMNERTYDSDKAPIRVLGIGARTDGGATVFDIEVTTDPEAAP
jgi:hypothetical protein